ncbi:hypothetical protein ACFLS1_10060 [Verrucomicrobiota bacterium]
MYGSVLALGQSLSGTNTVVSRVEVDLKVWPGEFGRTHDSGNPTNYIPFYSEFSNPGSI